MQTDNISRLQSSNNNNNIALVKTPSPLGTASDKLTNKLDNIFASVKKQIDEWGENAKWKIDLVLLDKPLSATTPQKPTQPNNQLHPLLSPQNFHPNAITTPFSNTSFDEEINSQKKYALPISATMDYPWEYTPPPPTTTTTQSSTMMNQDNRYTEDLQKRLNEAIERQHYLENIIWAQADQIKHTKEIGPQSDRVINTMKSIFLMSQNEQKVHHRVEVEMLQRDIDILSKKLHKMTSLVYSMEDIDLAHKKKDIDLDKDQLLEERTSLLRKIHLSDLRLSARDTEIEYLNECIKSLRSQQQQPLNEMGSPQPVFHPKRPRKGPPYLFQQQYSPRSSEVRSEQHHPLSGLESLGIVADQMLSDPEFESSNIHNTLSSEKRLRSRLDDRRSQRSMDSAATLLAMPQLISSKGKNEGMSSEAESKSPEDFHPIPKKPRSTYTRWTQEEDELLITAVKKYGHSNWEACSRDIHGRSNIQCRNRWIRHLEHKLMENNKPSTSPTIDDARHSPSIAALLNTSSENNNHGREHFTQSPRATPKQASSSSSNHHYDVYHTPIYRPPSPIATPKGKRRSAGNISTKW